MFRCWLLRLSVTITKLDTPLHPLEEVDRDDVAPLPKPSHKGSLKAREPAGELVVLYG